MNIVAADTAPPHFFLIGFRTPPGALFDKDNPNAQHLGAVVLRTKMQVGGAALAGGDVMTVDEPYPTFKPEGPFRLEAEIAPWKPALDVVVIDRLESFLTAAQQLDLGPPPNAAAVALHIAASHFGTVAINRGAGLWRRGGAAIRLAGSRRRAATEPGGSLRHSGHACGSLVIGQFRRQPVRPARRLRQCFPERATPARRGAAWRW